MGMQQLQEKRREIEQSLTTSFSRPLLKPFLRAVREYALVQPGDRVAVCLSGGKDSMLLAKLMQQLQRMGQIPFSLHFLSMDPGYPPWQKELFAENCRLMGIQPLVFHTDVLRIVQNHPQNPCFLCSRMRRGHLYAQAQALGCNKIALGHHFDDVVQTILMGMLYGGQVQTMLPRLQSAHYPGMQLIRPLYLVREADIVHWQQCNGLQFFACSCEFAAPGSSQPLMRTQVRQLLAELVRQNPQVEKNIFNSVKSIDLRKVLGYRLDGKTHHSSLPPL